MIIPMKSQKIIVIALLFSVVIGVKPSIGARLLENVLFISPENPSVFDTKLNSMSEVTRTSSCSGADPLKDTKEKTRKPCRMVDDNMKEAPNSEEIMMNVLAKGSVTPFGWSERGNNRILSVQRLAKSKHSPGVGHLQIFRTPKSTQEREVAHIEDDQGVSNKRILQSTPSPGAGH